MTLSLPHATHMFSHVCNCTSHRLSLFSLLKCDRSDHTLRSHFKGLSVTLKLLGLSARGASILLLVESSSISCCKQHSKVTADNTDV